MLLFKRPQRYSHLITQALPQRVSQSNNLPVIMLPASKHLYEQLAATVEGMRTTNNEGAVSTGSSFDTSSSDCDGAGSPAGTTSSTQTTSLRELPPAATSASIHLFPEGGMTNGRGMMRFSRGFMKFAADLPVVPCALRVSTCTPEVRSHTLTSNFGANLFWFSFPLWTTFEVTMLPAMQLGPGESKAAFVHRVQAAIAQELGCGVADLNVQQKRKMIQKTQRQKR